MRSKRVRREIRDLSERDWNAVVAAMWIMKTTSDYDGRIKFGDFFVSYDTMVAKHISAALDPAGDQAHFGPVLGIFHRAWLLQLENSLLAIDHRIEALPYWDYRRDIPPLQGKFKSIFDNEYMGAFVGQYPDFAVIDGKFARWKISTDSASHGKHNWKNAFGLLRNPISPNKSPYVTRRGGSVCGYQFGIGDVNSWNQCLAVGDNIMYWTSCVDSKVHGPAHTSIAGSWRREGQTFDSPDCLQWYGFIGAPPSSKVANNFVTGAMNEVYRYGTFVSPIALNCFSCPTCDKSRNLNDCMCIPRPSCGPLWTKLRVGDNLRKGSRFIDTSAMSPLAPSRVIQVLGDMGDPAGSPNDPMFWAHHANIDRHFESWMKNYASTSRSKYYYFPTKGFAPGCNLKDIISSTDPFLLLSKQRLSMRPYTIKDVFDEFTGENTPYTYDTLLKTLSEEEGHRLKELDELNFNRTSDRKDIESMPTKGIHSGSEQVPSIESDLQNGHLRGLPEILGINALKEESNVVRKTHLRSKIFVGTRDIILDDADLFIQKTLRSASSINATFQYPKLAVLSSSDYFSNEFVYATLVLLAILIGILLNFLFKRVIAFVAEQGDSGLKVAVTAEMRQSKYEIVTPDIYPSSHSNFKSGVRLRTRTPMSSEVRRSGSTSTNTFLLFSPTQEVD